MTRRKVTGLIILLFTITALALTAHLFEDFLNLSINGKFYTFKSQLAYIGQRILYASVMLVGFIYSLQLIITFRWFTQIEKRFKTTFIALLIIWAGLELHVYKCDFYEHHHSLWKSMTMHFH
ncbi:MAG: hypothetical protein RIC35_01615 [Marinoscillum sp.]